MAYLHASDGDTIEIRRRVYRIGELRSGEFALEIVPILCIACEENDVDEKGDLCPSCTFDALRWVRVMYVLDNVGKHNVPLARAITRIREMDAEMRGSGMSYVDSLSSARDMDEGDTPDVVRNAYMQFLRVNVLDVVKSGVE